MDSPGFLFIGGFGDSLTMGGTKAIRQLAGIDNVNTCSAFYTAGEITGTVASLVLPSGYARAAGTTVKEAFKEGVAFAKWVYKNGHYKNEYGAIPNPVNLFSDFNKLVRNPIDSAEAREWAKIFKASMKEGEKFGEYGNLTRVPGRTPVQGGGGVRDRYIDRKKKIYEFDYQHGRIERYDRFGNHLGEHYLDGSISKGPDSKRNISKYLQ